jgi:hypothetical protein
MREHLERPVRRLRAVAHAELAVDRRSVLLDAVRPEVKLRMSWRSGCAARSELATGATNGPLSETSTSATAGP